ncbi:MAG TPA: anthranilate synthase component I family protein [Bacteroidetes bacterium]|nr:anthranilate synthase component I family protein [Bacteroidota bacterium]
MIELTVLEKTLLADTLTPVSLYLRLRDRYPGSLLLESSDYHGKENALSFICFDPIASIVLENGILETQLPGQLPTQKPVAKKELVFDELDVFFNNFKIEKSESTAAKKLNGFFGYAAFDAVAHFETIELKAPTAPGRSIPQLCYKLFRFVLCINHFTNKMTLMENICTDGDLPKGGREKSKMEQAETLINAPVFPSFHFRKMGGEQTNMTDLEYMEMVRKGKQHCQRGDVFQIVLARQFSQAFEGDEFNVYRALRSVNPSPYLFYFDFGAFRIFGSSPEAQIQVQGNTAIINPIAGTVARTGDDSSDKAAAESLLADPKENAEHVMLVDLARNDLSRLAKNVLVKTYKEVQYFSHVIHLVSTVEGSLPEGASRSRLMGETFPAGTLSGAPKYRALQLIDEIEPAARGFYGGCVGFFNFDGEMNHAILIRSFFSKQNRLHYQAGAGIVKYSKEESECQEVFNKIGALRKAIGIAETI